MNRKLTCVLAGLGLLASVTSEAADINVILSGQVAPGVYGRVELGNASPPPLVYRDPLWIRKPPRPREVAPLYLHVPPGHAKRWSRYCARYDACDRPVYFVRSREYSPGYRPGPPPPPPPRQWRDERRDMPPPPPGPNMGPRAYDGPPPPPPGEYRDDRRDDRRDDQRDNDRDGPPGRGHGKGHDR